MDAIEFHGEPSSNIPTMVVAFGGWVDAGEAATGAMRYSIQEKDFLTNALKQPGPIQSVNCRAPEFLLVYGQT